MSDQAKPAVKLTGIEQVVLDRVIDLTDGERADVAFADLVKPYPAPAPPMSTRDVMAALQRLKAEHFLMSMVTYGVGGEGLARLEERRAARAAAETAAAKPAAPAAAEAA